MSSNSPILSAETDPFIQLELEKQPLHTASPRSILRSLLLNILHFRPFRGLTFLASLHFLLPSFLQRSHGPPQHQMSTAWLDGMRGWASFFVYIRHFASATHENIQVGYGRDADNKWLIQLPFLRLLVGGPAMVSLFFIISGYALSWAPLKQLHGKGGAEGALLRLSSATFRRAARLFLPAVVSTFIVACCVVLGLYDRGHAAVNHNDMPGFWEPEPPQYRDDPWYVQFQDWFWETWGFLKVWSPGGTSYDVHLWTLPVEFRCSIILFIALVGFARCRALLRAVMLFGMIVYCHYTDFWQGWLFFAGSFLAQLKFIQEESNAPASATVLPTDAGQVPAPSTPSTKTRSWADMLRLSLFVLGLYLLSAPDYGHASSAPGYMTLAAHFTPANWPESWRVLHCYGGFLCVYAASSTSTPFLRYLFSNPLSRYLGNISYALYLVHGPVVHMLGFWLVPWMWTHVIGRPEGTGAPGEMGMWGKELGFGYAFVIVTGVTVWGADLFWRGVDVKCVQLAKWVEGLMVEKR
jgi:peptidoglycan/LPS O-acetylase OafA/YrhL